MALRLRTDIMIQVPDSDAFSATMIEVMFGGGILITGAWLPYGKLKRNGIYHCELEEFKYLAVNLQDIIENLTSYKIKAGSNPCILKRMFSEEHITSMWSNAYNLAIKTSK